MPRFAHLTTEIFMPTPQATPAQPQAAPPKPEAPKPPKTHLFVSKEAEPYQFAVMGIKSVRYQKDRGRIAWEVPADKVERFKKHFHVKRGRIKKV